MSRLVVVGTAKNAEQFAFCSVISVRNQSEACHHIYVDDHSTDETFEAARAGFLREPRNSQSTFQLTRNPKEKGHIRNLIDTIHSLNPSDIVVWLDGDDWLWSSNSLSYVRAAYESPDTWLTFGQFVHSDGTPGWARDVYRGTDKPRERGFLATHLKTFRAGLFQQIRISDFLMPAYWGPEDVAAGSVIYPAETEAWMNLALDIAIMMPMLEMAGERYQFIDRILMCYENNPTAQRHDKREAELAEAKRVLAMKPYSRLERAPW